MTHGEASQLGYRSEQALLFAPIQYESRRALRILFKDPVAGIDCLGCDIVAQGVLSSCHGERIGWVLFGRDIEIRMLHPGIDD